MAQEFKAPVASSEDLGLSTRGDSQPSLTLLPGDPLTSSDIHRPCR